MTAKAYIQFGVFTLWLTILIVLLGCLWWYKTRPGSEATMLVQLSREDMGTKTGRYSIIMFAHPRCSCSEASFYEFESLIRDNPDLEAKLVLFYPEAGDSTWAKSKLWEKAHRNSKIQIVFDRGGEMARRFGALTSGHTLLYSSAGNLLFSGGVTKTRGHIGASEGGRAIAALVANKSLGTSIPQTPIFGCSIQSMQENLSNGQ